MTTDRSNIRKHGNSTHDKKGLKDEEVFQAVRLQSWFQDGKERYWVVDESQQIAQSSARKADRPRKRISPTVTKNTPNTALEGATIAARDGLRACNSAASINNPVAALEGGLF